MRFGWIVHWSKCQHRPWRCTQTRTQRTDASCLNLAQPDLLQSRRFCSEWPDPDGPSEKLTRVCAARRAPLLTEFFILLETSWQNTRVQRLLRRNAESLHLRYKSQGHVGSPVHVKGGNENHCSFKCWPTEHRLLVKKE